MATRPATPPRTARPAKPAPTSHAKPSANKPAKPVPSPRDVIFARVEARAAKAGIKLRSGASPKELARTEKDLGLTLPDDMRAWYRRHDGSDGDDPYFWPLELVRVHRAMFNHFIGPHAVVFVGIDDDVTGIDLSPAGAGKMFAWVPEEGPSPMDQTFLEWLATFEWKW